MSNFSDSLRRSALRRGVLLAPEQKLNSAPEAVRFAATVEFANLGFIVSPDELLDFSATYLKSCLDDARTVLGADRDMTPIYPGFPKQVQDLDTLTLLVEQILHYWTGGDFLPNYPTVARAGQPLEDMLRNARKLTVKDANSFSAELLAELVAKPVALSEADRELLDGAVGVYYSKKSFDNSKMLALTSISDLSKSATNGENLQSFVRSLAPVVEARFDLLRSEIFEVAANRVRSSDHLLRLILTLFTEPAADKWKKNYELAVNSLANRHARAVRYSSIPKSSRRRIVIHLGELSDGFRADRLVARKDLWRGALRAIHSYDFKMTTAGRRAADIVHGNVDYRTLNSLVEEAMEQGNAGAAAKLLAEHQPGNLLRRLVALLRLTSTQSDADALAAAVLQSASRASLTTLISSYNGVLSANDEHARVTRVAGLNNTVRERKDFAKIDARYQAAVLEALDQSIVNALQKAPAPTSPVSILSTVGVPLVERDAATADRVLDRGQELVVAGEGDTLRIFGHWNNNLDEASYMDIGAVVLDANFKEIGVSNWRSWNSAREWSTYSGDKLVTPGDSAAEFIDVNLEAVRREFCLKAHWVVMTTQAWAGWSINKVDFIAGAMLRNKAEAGEVFDARAVVTAFKPTTESAHSIPFAVNLKTGKLVWVDTSNGSTEAHQSADSDSTVGSLVYDEIVRPRFTLGQLAERWATAHGVKTVNKAVDRELLLGLL